MGNANFLAIRPASELLELTGPPEAFLLEPILAPGSVALIYGPPGVGKSFLALGLALAAAGGGSMLGWTAPRAHKVLYLDGEMRRATVAERLRLLGPPPPSLQMWLATEQAGDLLDLATEEGIVRLMSSWRRIDLVVIDSLSSLAGVTGGDPESWSELRRFVAHQQQVGRSVVMVHHANRDGTLRGTGRRVDMADIVMRLRRPRDWQPADGARFELQLEKARALTGTAIEPIEAQLRTGPDGCAEWQWHRGASAALRRAAPLFQQGMSAEAVGRAIGVSPRTAYRLQRQARERGWAHRTSGDGSEA
jgi:putative DNA primase/helicase